MRRILMSLILVLAAAAAQAADADDPVGLIQSIYRTYTAGNAKAGLPHVYSARLQALVDADAKKTPKGDAGTIDWDVFVDGNDWDVSNLTVTLLKHSETRAQVRAKFDNFKEPRTMLFSLVHEKRRWRIDDISSLQKGGRWTMSKILTGAPDAFPDEVAGARKAE